MVHTVLENLFEWFFTYPLMVIGDFHVLPALLAVPILLGLPHLLERVGVFEDD